MKRNLTQEECDLLNSTKLTLREGITAGLLIFLMFYLLGTRGDAPKPDSSASSNFATQQSK